MDLNSVCIGLCIFPGNVFVVLSRGRRQKLAVVVKWRTGFTVTSKSLYLPLCSAKIPSMRVIHIFICSLAQFLICSLRKPGIRVQEANMQKHIKLACLCGRYVGEKRGTERRGVIMREEDREKKSELESKSGRKSGERKHERRRCTVCTLYYPCFLIWLLNETNLFLPWLFIAGVTWLCLAYNNKHQIPTLFNCM